MRSFLLTAAAAAAIASPAIAETTGAIGAGYSNSEYENGYDYDTWSLQGSVFHRIAGPWAVQGEGHYESADYGAGSDDEGNFLAIHGLYATEGWTVGLLAGQGGLFDADDELDFFGAEGALRVGNWTLTGSAISGEFFADYDRYRVGGKYFFSDNLAFGAGVAWADYGTSDWETYDIGGEFRFAGLPVTLTGGFVRSDFSWSEVDTWTIGARWDFGSGTLREADRTAPISDLENYLGDIRRWD